MFVCCYSWSTHSLVFNKYKNLLVSCIIILHYHAYFAFYHYILKIIMHITFIAGGGGVQPLVESFTPWPPYSLLSLSYYGFLWTYWGSKAAPRHLASPLCTPNGYCPETWNTFECFIDWGQLYIILWSRQSIEMLYRGLSDINPFWHELKSDRWLPGQEFKTSFPCPLVSEW